MTSHLAAGLLLLCLSAAAVVVPWLAGVVGAECQTSCGGVDIPFPFGMGPDGYGCWLTPDFRISCDDVGGNGSKPFMMVTGPNSTYGDSDTNMYASVEVLNIYPEQAKVKVLHPLSYKCYDDASNTTSSQQWSWDLRNTSYSLSSTANNFMVVGCWGHAYIVNSVNIYAPTTTATDLSGCLSVCSDDGSDLASLKPCNGLGCCQTEIPMGLQYYGMLFADVLDRKEFSIPGTCNIAVPMASSYFWYNLSLPNKVTSKSLGEAFNTSLGGKAPVVLDWSIGHDNCSTARTKPAEYACISRNSFCYDDDLTSGRAGYICKCRSGYMGNPYLPDGCQDIDECRDNPCDFGDCKNIDGDYVCHCPPGQTGDAYTRDGCRKDLFPPSARIATGISLGLFVALLIACLSTEVLRNKENKKRQKYFEQHGGQMLMEILKREGNIPFKFYDRGVLEKATGDFHKDNIVGEGAHGNVYKAILGDATVAVKCCKQIDETRTSEFVRELVVLSRASHPNVVKLLGCCLHFEAPMIVYEFVPMGTLSKLLHGRPRRPVTLPTRLRIAAETAEALADLHSPPHRILHGDIKPENILLGKGLTAKVSDFGCSTINDNVQVVPKGTLAYLDPEFLKDRQITEKTDVYSFGVVLIELLTGKNPQAKQYNNLTTMFQNKMENGTLGDLLDADIVGEGSMGLIHAVAKLVSRCIAAPGTARPAMEQVAVELRRLSDQMPEPAEECSEVRMALEIEDASYSYTTSIEGETTGFSNLTAGSTELAR